MTLEKNMKDVESHCKEEQSQVPGTGQCKGLELGESLECWKNSNIESQWGRME